jgi:hypothetical protein
MGKFLSEDEPRGRYLNYDKEKFVLVDAVIYMPFEDKEDIIIAEEGFETDWASIPRLAQVIIPKSVGRRPFVIHDKLYETLGLNGKYTRAECDEIMLLAMKDDGIAFLTRQAIYRAVRMGGWVPWKIIKNRYETNETE